MSNLSDIKNEVLADVRSVKEAVVGTAVRTLESRKFVLAIAGFVAALAHVPTEAIVPLVAVILAEGAADIKGRSWL